METAPPAAPPWPAATAPESLEARQRHGSPLPRPWHRPGGICRCPGGRWVPGHRHGWSDGAGPSPVPGPPVAGAPHAANTAGSHRAVLPGKPFHPHGSHNPSAPGSSPPAESAPGSSHRPAWQTGETPHHTRRTTEVPAPGPDRSQPQLPAPGSSSAKPSRSPKRAPPQPP